MYQPTVRKATPDAGLVEAPRHSRNCEAGCRHLVAAGQQAMHVAGLLEEPRSVALHPIDVLVDGAHEEGVPLASEIGESVSTFASERSRLCPQRNQPSARRCPAELVEKAVLAVIADGVLPGEVLEAARRELRQRLATPATRDVGRLRARLTGRLDRLKQQHGWGDITETQYQVQRDETRAALAALPNGDRVAVFDAYRTQVLELPEAIKVASPARREELCRIVLERVVVRDREIDGIDWTPAARPFNEKRRECPQGDSNP